MLISHYLGSNPLGDLLEAALLMEFEALTRTLSLSESHTVVKVGRGFQLFPWFLLQLLTELFSFYSTNVRYRDTDEQRCKTLFNTTGKKVEVREKYLSVWACDASVQFPCQWHLQFFLCHPE